MQIIPLSDTEMRTKYPRRAYKTTAVYSWDEVWKFYQDAMNRPAGSRMKKAVDGLYVDVPCPTEQGVPMRVSAKDTKGECEDDTWVSGRMYLRCGDGATVAFRHVNLENGDVIDALSPVTGKSMSVMRKPRVGYPCDAPDSRKIKDLAWQPYGYWSERYPITDWKTLAWSGTSDILASTNKKSMMAAKKAREKAAEDAAARIQREIETLYEDAGLKIDAKKAALKYKPDTPLTKDEKDTIDKALIAAAKTWEVEKFVPKEIRDDSSEVQKLFIRMLKGENEDWGLWQAKGKRGLQPRYQNPFLLALKKKWMVNKRPGQTPAFYEASTTWSNPVLLYGDIGEVSTPQQFDDLVAQKDGKGSSSEIPWHPPSSFEKQVMGESKVWHKLLEDGMLPVSPRTFITFRNQFPFSELWSYQGGNLLPNV